MPTRTGPILEEVLRPKQGLAVSGLLALVEDIGSKPSKAGAQAEG